MFDLHFNFSSIGLTSLHSVLYFYNVVQKVGMKNIAVLCSSTSSKFFGVDHFVGLWSKRLCGVHSWVGVSYTICVSMFTASWDIML